MRRGAAIAVTAIVSLLGACSVAGDQPSSSADPSLTEAASAVAVASSAPPEPSPTPAWEEIDLPEVTELGDRVLAAVELPGAVCDIAASETSLWVTIRGEGLLLELDPETYEIRQEINFGDDACTVAWSGGSVWVGVFQDLIQHIERIDPATGETIGTIDFRLASSIFAMDDGPGGLWVLNRQRMEVYRVDTESGEIAETFAVGYGASDMEVTDEAVWVTSDVSGGLTRIDTATGEISEVPVDFPMGVAVDEQGLWAYIPVHHQLTLIDPVTFEQLTALRFDLETGEPETAAGAIWLPTEEGFLIAFHSGTATPGAVFAIPEGIDTAKEVLGDLWVYGAIPGIIRIEPGDIEPAASAT